MRKSDLMCDEGICIKKKKKKLSEKKKWDNNNKEIVFKRIDYFLVCSFCCTYTRKHTTHALTTLNSIFCVSRICRVITYRYLVFEYLTRPRAPSAVAQPFFKIFSGTCSTNLRPIINTYYTDDWCKFYDYNFYSTLSSGWL